MDILKIHTSKVLRDIQEVLMKDIVNTIDIINDRVELPVPASIYENTIELQSVVTGYEGLHPILFTEVVLTENLIPCIIIETLGREEGLRHEFTLRSVDLNKLIYLKEGSKRKYNKVKEDEIILMTQAERVDISDFVSDIFEDCYLRYEFAGKLIKRKPGLL